MIEPKRQKKSWVPLDPEDEKSRNKFLEILKRENVDDEIANEMAAQILGTTNDNHNIVFLFTEGEYAVTAIHVPDESLNGQTGPILMPGSTEKSIIAAFSASFIQDKIKNVDFLEDSTGLPSVADAAWTSELEKMVEIVRLEISTNPPSKWDSLLEE